MHDILFLPYPKSFAKYCKYSLDEALPVWFSGCLTQNSILLFSDLFGSDLEYKDLDKASVNAINEFAMNIIDTDQLFNNLDVSGADILLTSLINSKPILDILNRNNLLLLSDLTKLGPENLLKVKNLGIKKVIYISIAIARFIENLPKNASANDEAEDISDEDTLSIVKKYSDELPLSSIYLFDPRFKAIYQSYWSKLNLDMFDYPTWNDLFVSGEFSSNNEKIAAIEQFCDEYKLLNDLSLEEQMSHFFINYIKLSTKPGNLIKKVDGFNNIRDRLGIKESTDKKYKLQETGDSFPTPVTRERVRQLVAKYNLALDSIPENEEIFIPKLSEVLKILQENINKSIANIAKIISNKGYGEWSIHRLLDCLELFRLPNQLTISGEFLTDKSMVKANAYITKMATKIIRYNGAVNTDHLHNAISSNFSIEKEYLLDVLKNSFDEITDNWFYIISQETHLTSLAQRMANFSRVYSIQSLREAHIKHKSCREAGQFRDKSRPFFYGYVTPPSEVIGKAINSSEDFNIKDGNIHCINLNNNFTDDPSVADYQFLKYFQARNFDCATYTEMIKFFIVENKMPEGSFFQHLSYKPYIKRLSREIYGIVGQEADSLSVDNARDRIKKFPVKIGWSETGLEIKMKLTVVEHFAVSLQKYDNYITKDEFKVFYNGEEYCVLKRSKNFWHGIGHYLKSILFCEIGDFIKVKLDLSSYEARFELISEDEFED